MLCLLFLLLGGGRLREMFGASMLLVDVCFALGRDGIILEGRDGIILEASSSSWCHRRMSFSQRKRHLIAPPGSAKSLVRNQIGTWGFTFPRCQELFALSFFAEEDFALSFFESEQATRGSVAQGMEIKELQDF